MMTSAGSEIRSDTLPFTATWRQRRVTDQFQDDPLRNLAMSKHALTECYTLLEKEELLLRMLQNILE